MPSPKSGFLDKVLGRLGRLDTEGLQSVVHRLARERNLLETVFNTIEDGVLVVDETGKLVYFNRAAPNLLGWHSDLIEGTQVDKILPEIDWAEVRRWDEKGGKKVSRHEFELTFPRPRFFRLYAAPLDGESTGSAGLALILHDATEAREQTFQAIESERIQALTLLAASVAHEIGNPLNALHIHLQLLERELRKAQLRESSLIEARNQNRRKLSARSSAHRERVQSEEMEGSSLSKMENYLEVAKGEITRLDYIVTQFLQAIRPSQPKYQEASLNVVAIETLELLGPELQNRELIVEKKLARHLPLARFDPAQIKQVLVNLVKNAMQAMTQGGVLTVETGSNPEGVWIGVGDTGEGIPQDQINRIYEPFYTTKKKGSGLGLMIVHRIVREHGGRIELQSKENFGTRFRVWLPLGNRPTRLISAPNP